MEYLRRGNILSSKFLTIGILVRGHNSLGINFGNKLLRDMDEYLQFVTGRERLSDHWTGSQEYYSFLSLALAIPFLALE